MAVLELGPISGKESGFLQVQFKMVGSGKKVGRRGSRPAAQRATVSCLVRIPISRSGRPRRTLPIPRQQFTLSTVVGRRAGRAHGVL